MPQVSRPMPPKQLASDPPADTRPGDVEGPVSEPRGTIAMALTLVLMILLVLLVIAIARSV